MTNYREILRLSSLQYSQRTIESMAHCSRHTVRDVLQAAKEQGISWPLSDDVANADLEQLLFPNRHKASSQYAEPDYPYIHRELARSGVTLTLLWEEYCAKCQEAGKRPYMSTQFGERYRRWARITKATMRIQHKPGDAMQVDWAGDTIPIQDPVTGEQSAAYLFVAVLPCSYYTYAEACDDMKTENWAMSVSPMTEKVAEHFLKSGKAAKQGYKACAGLTKLEQRYGKQRLEAACGKTLAYSTTPSLRTIASILKNDLDKAESQLSQSKANSYGITRGAAYFRKGGDR